MKNWLIFLLCVTCAACVDSDTTIRKKAEQAYAKKDYATALTLYVKLAKRGDVTAQVQVGVLHYMGWGTEKNQKEASAWYKKAAEQGNPTAMNNLAGLLSKGAEGVPQDMPEAIRWYEKCNERSACFATLGYIYVMGGGGVQVNYAEAARLFTLGANREIRIPGNIIEIEDKARSQMGLAYLHEERRGVQQDCKVVQRLLILASSSTSTTMSDLAKRRLNETSRPCGGINGAQR